MANLGIDFSGVHFKNPMAAASAKPTRCRSRPISKTRDGSGDWPMFMPCPRIRFAGMGNLWPQWWLRMKKQPGEQRISWKLNMFRVKKNQQNDLTNRQFFGERQKKSGGSWLRQIVFHLYISLIRSFDDQMSSVSS